MLTISFLFQNVIFKEKTYLKNHKIKQDIIISLEINEISKLTYMLQNYPKQTLPDRFRLITIIHL